MDEHKLEISKHLTKKGVRNEIVNFLDEYEEKYNPFVKVELKNSKKIYGMVSGGMMRYSLPVFKLRGGLQAIEFKEICTMQILNNNDVLQLFTNLLLFFNLKKETKELNEKLDNSQQKVEEMFNIKL